MWPLICILTTLKSLHHMTNQLLLQFICILTTLKALHHMTNRLSWQLICILTTLKALHFWQIDCCDSLSVILNNYIYEKKLTKMKKTYFIYNSAMSKLANNFLRVRSKPRNRKISQTKRNEEIKVQFDT